MLKYAKIKLENCKYKNTMKLYEVWNKSFESETVTIVKYKWVH